MGKLEDGRFCQSALPFLRAPGGTPPEDKKAETTSRRLFAAASACRSCGQRAKRHVSANAETRAGAGSRPEIPSLGAVQVFEVDAYEVHEPSPLERELIARGIAEHTAAELVASYPPERIESQIERFDWSKTRQPKSIAKSDGGFLAEAIRKNYPMPNGFESKADREQRETAEKLKKQQEREEAQRAKAAKQREADLDRKAFERWDAMSTGERIETEAAALAWVEESVRQSYEKSTQANFKRAFLERIRQSYLRDLIDREESARKK